MERERERCRGRETEAERERERERDRERDTGEEGRGGARGKKHGELMVLLFSTNQSCLISPCASVALQRKVCSEIGRAHV